MVAMVLLVAFAEQMKTMVMVSDMMIIVMKCFCPVETRSAKPLQMARLPCTLYTKMYP